MKTVVLALLLASSFIAFGEDQQPVKPIGDIEKIETVDLRSSATPTTITKITDDYLYFRVPQYGKELRVTWGQVKYPKRDEVLEAIKAWEQKKSAQKISATSQQ